MSRPVRWDSDHVCILNDDTTTIAEEIVRSGAVKRVHIALDYFDASINRVQLTLIMPYSVGWCLGYWCTRCIKSVPTCSSSTSCSTERLRS